MPLVSPDLMRAGPFQMHYNTFFKSTCPKNTASDNIASDMKCSGQSCTGHKATVYSNTYKFPKGIRSLCFQLLNMRA